MKNLDWDQVLLISCIGAIFLIKFTCTARNSWHNELHSTNTLQVCYHWLYSTDVSVHSDHCHCVPYIEYWSWYWSRPYLSYSTCQWITGYWWLSPNLKYLSKQFRTMIFAVMVFLTHFKYATNWYHRRYELHYWPYPFGSVNADLDIGQDFSPFCSHFTESKDLEQ